jgi:hypothetical protein
MGGKIDQALDYIKTNKIVGGSYENEGTQQTKTIPTGGPTGYTDCLQYWNKVCDPTQEACGAVVTYDPKSTTFCPTNCNRKTGATVEASKVSGLIGPNISTLTSYTNMKTSVTGNKPVVSSMEIFEDMDFYLGTDNIYIHTNGQSLGVVNVIIIGHDTDTATNMNYWTVLVPWDKKFTDGINAQKLRIVAGINHCNIENKGYEIRVSST